jgi:hypothetical protein
VIGNYNRDKSSILAGVVNDIFNQSSFAISNIMIVRAAGIFFILLVTFKQIFIIVYFPSIILLKEEVDDLFRKVKEHVYKEVEGDDDEENI